MESFDQHEHEHDLEVLYDQRKNYLRDYGRLHGIEFLHTPFHEFIEWLEALSEERRADFIHKYEQGYASEILESDEQLGKFHTQYMHYLEHMDDASRFTFSQSDFEQLLQQQPEGAMIDFISAYQTELARMIREHEPFLSYDQTAINNIMIDSREIYMGDLLNNDENFLSDEDLENS